MKSFKKILSIVMSAVLVLVLFSACSETPAATTFTVTFDSKGGSAVAEAKVSQNSLLTKPADPARDEYNFAGWYKDRACTKAWDFENDKVTADTTLYAKWTAKDYKKWVTETFQALDNYEPDGLNTYTATYDEMVAYLKEQGVIAADAEPVDMQTTEGYLFSGESLTYDGCRPFADKAYAYGDVMLVWWDMNNGSEYADIYENMAYNNNTIVIDGGIYVMPTTSVSGYFALNVKPVCDAQNDRLSADRHEKINAKIKEYESVFDIFEGIDSRRTKLSQYYSMTELLLELRKEGLITPADIAKTTNLNEEYRFVGKYYSSSTTYTREHAPRSPIGIMIADSFLGVNGTQSSLGRRLCKPWKQHRAARI